MTKYHYTYRITNTVEQKHYYGARSSSIHPTQDLGIKYFSSSYDKEFMSEQKLNPQNFKYKIIKIFETREEAIALEIKLHSKFNVGVNESFYNKAKQTSTRFDYNIEGKISVFDIKSNKHKFINKIDFNKNQHRLEGGCVGVKRSNEFKQNMSKRLKGVKKPKHQIEKGLKSKQNVNPSTGNTIMKDACIKAQKTKEIKFQNDVDYFKNIFQKISESKNKIETNGKTKAQNAAAKQKITKNILNNDGKTVYEITAEKQKITMSTLEDNGKTKAQNNALKASLTMKTKQLDNGLTIYENSALKIKQTKYIKSKKYDVYNIFDEKIFFHSLTPKEMRKISASLPSKTKEQWLAKDSLSLQNRLKNLKQEYKIGLYCVLI